MGVSSGRRDYQRFTGTATGATGTATGAAAPAGAAWAGLA
jgi:hypothetical protein